MQSTEKSEHRIRPKRNIGKAITQRGPTTRDDDGCISGDGIEEGRIIATQKAVGQPTKKEWDNDMRTHIPFRK